LKHINSSLSELVLLWLIAQCRAWLLCDSAGGARARVFCRLLLRCCGIAKRVRKAVCVAALDTSRSVVSAK
jgi:hypothetical protein